MIANNNTIGTVESCTAGAISKSIVSVAGSSAYFQGSFLTYSNELKKKLVNVTSERLDNRTSSDEKAAWDSLDHLDKLKYKCKDFCKESITDQISTKELEISPHHCPQSLLNKSTTITNILISLELKTHQC